MLNPAKAAHHQTQERPAISTADKPPLFIGTAGWTIPPQSSAAFPAEGTHLQRYAGFLNGAEINSSFHRPHREATYIRWRESVPAGFRFSVKIPKTITHKNKLVGVEPLLEEFIGPVGGLGEKLGCLLVQLPPSLAFDEAVASTFFTQLRSHHEGEIACEPRNESWFTPEAEALLGAFRVARVAADPVKPAGALEPAGAKGIRYFRLHGSPRMYYSSYEESYLIDLARRLHEHLESGATVWCIFDNTTLGAAMPNALELLQMVKAGGAGPNRERFPRGSSAG